MANTRWLGGFHYLSTVSGGGYIGAFLQGMLKEHGLHRTMEELDPGSHPERASDRHNDKVHGHTIRELRAYSNYLTPNKARFSADRVTLVTTFIGNMLLMQAQLVGWFLLALSIPYAMYFVATQASDSTNGATTTMLAAAFAAIAMGIRGLDQLSADAAADKGETHHSPPGVQFMPPLLLAGAISLIAILAFATPFVPLTQLKREQISGAGAPAVTIVFLTAQLTWLLLWSFRPKRARGRGKKLILHLFFGTACAALAAMALDALQRRLFITPLPSGTSPWEALIFGAPFVFAIYFCTSLLYVGLTLTREEDRLPRERWARLFGRVGLFVVFLVSLPVALVAYGPVLLDLSSGWMTQLAVTLPIVWGAVGAYVAYFDRVAGPTRNGLRTIAKDALIALAPVAMVLGALVLSVALGEWLILGVKGRGSELAPLTHALAAGKWPVIGAKLLAIAMFVTLLRILIDDNEFSMNGFYRNRLVRCYLAPSRKKRNPDPDIGLDPADDQPLAEFSSIKI